VRRDLLLHPQQERDLPRIMQWIGWTSAMALNRLTERCCHFWEARYFSTPIDPGDTRRVLVTRMVQRGDVHEDWPSLKAEIDAGGIDPLDEPGGLRRRLMQLVAPDQWVSFRK
jgi:hypothetical protein